MPQESFECPFWEPFNQVDACFSIAARAARYSSSVISVASFCLGGCAGGGLAGLDDDAPPNSQGFARRNCAISSAALTRSPFAVSSTFLRSISLRPSRSTIPARTASTLSSARVMRARIPVRSLPIDARVLRRAYVVRLLPDLCPVQQACRFLTSVASVGIPVRGNAREFARNVLNVEGVGDRLDCALATDLTRDR